MRDKGTPNEDASPSDEYRHAQPDSSYVVVVPKLYSFRYEPLEAVCIVSTGQATPPLQVVSLPFKQCSKVSMQHEPTMQSVEIFTIVFLIFYMPIIYQ